MVKREGHSHTEFCPHGSGDDVELMIQKAIRLGFDRYSITEHAPLPAGFSDDYRGKKTGLTEAAISMSDLEPYFKKANEMKTKYADQIQIQIGFEVDYLPEFTNWTKAFLDEYGPRTTDNILSVHFLKGRDGHYWCVDDTLADFQTGLLSQFQDSQSLYRLYFEQVNRSIRDDLGKFAPQRIGHMTLIKKFQDHFRLDSAFSPENLGIVSDILLAIKSRGRQLDLNAAGLYKKDCNEQYPSLQIIEMARVLKIPMIYGSDAHSVADIGRGYHALADFVTDSF